MMEWISTNDRLPSYGVPVLICIKGVVQHIIYHRDGADDFSDWFEPHFFENEHEFSAFVLDVTHWMPLPEPPKT